MFINKHHVHYQPLNADDFQRCRAFYQDEGWNHSPEDLECFYQIDRAGLMGAYIDNQLIGSLYAANFDNHFTSLGFFVIDKNYRHQHIGFDLFESIQDQIAHRQIVFHSPSQLIHVYESLGFHFSHWVEKLSISPPGLSDIHHLSSWHDIDFQSLLAYDRRHFPANRQAFLLAWLKRPGSQGFGYLQNGKILGFGVISPNQQGFTIGPLFAENEDICLALIAKLCHQHQGPFILFSPNHEAPQTWRKQVKAESIAKIACLYRYSLGHCEFQHIFGLTSIELG